MPRPPTLSSNTSSLTARVYSALADRARQNNDVIYPLHVGDTYRKPVVQARAESQSAADHPGLHAYAPVQGEPDLLNAIVNDVKARHDVAIDPTTVQVMSGATAGLNVVCSAILEPGDEVLLPSPFWPLIRGVIATKGATPVQVPFYTRVDEPGFDAEAVLEQAVTDKTVAIYINTPHNPTGTVLAQPTLDAIAKVATRHNLWVLCDEAYENLYFDSPPPTLWKHPDLKDRVIASHTFSKTYGMAGARVGFTHGPASVMNAIIGMQTYQTYCAPRPMQRAAIAAIKHGGNWLAEARRDYAQAAAIVAGTLDIDAPTAGTFVFFDSARYFPDAADDCTPFLEACADRGVLLTPGGACGEHYRSWVRLCFTSVPLPDLGAAMTRIQPLL